MATSFNPDLLKGKVAFVTGGGSGICKGITLAFMQHGCACAILGRKLDRLKASAAELTAQTGIACLPVRMDVRNPAEVEAAFAAVLAEFGKVDIVVNGAAGNFLSPAATLTYKGFRTVMEIDTMGTFNVSKAAHNAWLGEHGGVILNISAWSRTVLQGTPLQVHAGSAKAAVDAMTCTLAKEWGPAGIRVVAITPGPISGTEGMKRLGGGKKAIEEKFKGAIPLLKYGVASDIADASLFLVSDAARMITGVILLVDGGSWLSPGDAITVASL